MDIGGGSTKTVTSNTGTNAPWSEAQPALKQAISGAQDLYNNQAGSNFYDQSLVVPFAQETLQGMQGIKNTADAYAGDLQQPMQHQLDTMASGGFNPTQQAALAQMNQFAGGTGYNQEMSQAAGSLGNLNDQMNQGGGLTSYQQDAMSRAQDLASGSEVMGTNPGFQRNLQQAQQSAKDAANEMAMKTGRYNSATHQGQLSEDVANVTAGMYDQEYSRQLQRQDAARDQQFGMSQQGVGNVQSSAQGLAQLGQTGYGNLSDSVGRQFEAGQIGQGNVQAAAGQIPTAYNALQQPYRDYMNVGGMQEDLQTRQMQDDLRRFRESDEAGWERLAKLNAIASGAGQLGSSTTSSTQAPTSSPFQNALQTGNNLGLWDNMFGGSSSGGGGFLGGL
jgi:hypothetical protein